MENTSSYYLDPITLSVLIGESFAIGILTRRYRRARREIESITSSNKERKYGKFVVTISKADAYSYVLLLPLLSTISYLVLYYLVGSISWSGGNNIIVRDLGILVLLQTTLVIGSIYVSRDLVCWYYVVSNGGIKRHHGSKITLMRWGEIQGIGQLPESGEIDSLVLYGENKRFLFEHSMCNFDRFYEISSERIPADVRESQTHKATEEWSMETMGEELASTKM